VSASKCVSSENSLRISVKLGVGNEFHFDQYRFSIASVIYISGQGYITTNNQSVSMSWYRAQSRTIDQSLLSP
jgi:hypothetical protein